MITNTMSCESITLQPLKTPFSVGLILLVLLVIVLCVIVLRTPFADAQSLKIVDCHGRTHASKNIPSVESTNVEVSVTSPEAAPNVRLVNSAGDTITGNVTDGVATFSNVPQGVWVIASETPQTFFSAITFQPTFGFYWPTFGETALVAGTVLGGVLVGRQIESSGSSGGGGDSGGNGGSGNCPTCNPDQEAPSIVPFSRRK